MRRDPDPYGEPVLVCPAGHPRYRRIVALDIEGSTTRVNSEKAKLRRAMYALFESALSVAGITERHRDPLIDRGDGVFALVRPLDEVPTTILLDTLIPVLNRLLAEHNHRHPEERLRMRVAVHAGEVHYDENGCYGEALDLTFRLLDAPQTRRKLRESPGWLVLAISDHIFRTIVRHGYSGIDESSYCPGGTVTVAGQRSRGYLHTPGGHALARSPTVPGKPRDRPSSVVRSRPPTRERRRSESWRSIR